MSTIKTVTKEQWAVLAGVRFWLALCVFFFHSDISDPTMAQNHWYFAGDGAVIGFLLISGFSIAASFQQQPKGYYSRRAWRIYPAYMLAILIAWILTNTPIIQFVPCVLMLQGMITITPEAIGPAWTLAPECWMYIIAPKINLIIASIFAFISIAFVIWRAHQNDMGFHHSIHGVSLLYLAWPWMLGYLYYHTRNIGFLYLAFAFEFLVTRFMGGANWFFFSNANVQVILTILALGITPKKVIFQPLLNYIGRLSYPIYICHYAILIWARQYKFSWPISLIITILLCIHIVRIEDFLQRWRKVRARHLSSQTVNKQQMIHSPQVDLI